LLELTCLLPRCDYRLVFSTPADPLHNPRNVMDRTLLHLHKPHEHRIGVMTGGDLGRAWRIAPAQRYPYDVRFDQHGFRNDTDLASADIAVIGDSFVEAGMVASERLMSTTLSRLLGCTVANLGQVAYGPQQELEVLKRYGVALRPRLIVWAFFEGND